MATYQNEEEFDSINRKLFLFLLLLYIDQRKKPIYIKNISNNISIVYPKEVTVLTTFYVLSLWRNVLLHHYCLFDSNVGFFRFLGNTNYQNSVCKNDEKSEQTYQIRYTFFFTTAFWRMCAQVCFLQPEIRVHFFCAFLHTLHTCLHQISACS